MRLNWHLRPAGGKTRGWVRRGLSIAGPTWLASPLQRLIQAFCFAVFLALFLYVCWPYTARPGAVWPGWLPVKVDAQTGKLTLAPGGSPAAGIEAGNLVHVVDSSDPQRAYLGPFRVTSAESDALGLEPAERLEPAALERLAVSFGPWSLSEREPDGWPSHYADDLARKRILPAEIFLALDPLVSISTAVAARAWVWSLWAAGAMLVVCLFVPRGFCGYVCPLGTLIDLFDWGIGKRVGIFRLASRGWWASLKYGLLAAVLAASLCGVLISGFVAAIPVVTRGMAFVCTPVQTGLDRGWHQVPPVGAGQIVSIVLLAAVLGLGLLGKRFWCRYVCPTGAVFSLGNLFRLSERKVEPSCIACNRCVEICPFDAIHADFTTRTADCTFCQTCGGACPTKSIQFLPRWSKLDETPADVPPGDPRATSRRAFLGSAAGIGVAAVGGAAAAAAARALAGTDDAAASIVRPPCSVPEPHFLAICIRCGECFQACPNDVLQPLGFSPAGGGLWTPRVVADWSGCEPSCNNCGHVCPTGAIRAMPLEEKRAAKIGLAVVDEQTCLPYAGREECQLCVDECVTAGYRAIEFARVGTEVDVFGAPVEGTGFLAPVVLAEKCNGCGLCQSRCRAINTKQKGLLDESAVRVQAGPGKEDRLTHGSYLALRADEEAERRRDSSRRLDQGGADEGYLPSFLD